VAKLELDVKRWAEQQFGACELGDRRRTKRAVTLAASVAAHPDGSTPDQTETWSDCKAAYRLFDQENVTFRALCQPHWQATRAQSEGTWLLIGDTTEIDFPTYRQIEGLGPTGNGGGRGFFLHSSLMIHAESEEIAGLAAAELFHRQAAPHKNESSAAKKKRPRESEVWGRVIDEVGPAPQAARFVHVFDAGADNYEVFCHLRQQDCGWVVRAAQKHRVVYDPQGERGSLQELVSRQPVAGTYELSLRTRPRQPARTATIEVRIAPLTMPPPPHQSPFMKQCGIQGIPMWVVEAREVSAPRNVKPLHWVLLTSEAVEDFEEAWNVISWYEKRPLVEEYHKCLKTGCRVEDRQYETSARLERVTGLLSVVAVRLLQLKSVARETPDRPAEEVVPRPWIRMLECLRKERRPLLTVGDFFRSLAKLGGFLGRKHDGDPGWITLWRGFKKLNLCLRGAKAIRQKCG
jgi:hypothetical protein